LGIDQHFKGAIDLASMFREGIVNRSRPETVKVEMSCSSLFVAILLATACGSSEPVRIGEASTTSAVLMPTPRQILHKCERYPQLEPACPTKVPAVEDATFHRARASSERNSVWVFFAEWNGPHPGLTKRHAPPAFAHVNAFAGDVQWMAGFHIDQASDKDPPEERTSGLSFGERTWNGRTGELLLASSYPHGGMEGDHLAFRWTQEGVDYSLSLHAWDPLGETEATLKALVDSLP
jgi:hypothetical protein